MVQKKRYNYSAKERDERRDERHGMMERRRENARRPKGTGEAERE